MPTLEELIQQRDYYVGMQCNLHQKKREIDEKISEYRELEIMMNEQIRRREGEEGVNTV